MKSKKKTVMYSCVKCLRVNFYVQLINISTYKCDLLRFEGHLSDIFKLFYIYEW